MKKYLFLITFAVSTVLGLGLFQHTALAVATADVVARKACLFGTFNTIRPDFKDCDNGGKIGAKGPAMVDIQIPINSDGKSFKVGTQSGSLFSLMNPKQMIYVEVYMTDGNSYSDFASNGSAKTNKATGGESRELVLSPYMQRKYNWAVRKVSDGFEFYLSNGQYPIAELGNCQSENDCKNYCTKTENMLACANYGEKNGLISPEDAKKAKDFADVLGGGGPGGCKDQKGCESYCTSTAHLNECLNFAEKHNLLPAEQLKQAKQVLKALGDGGKLPGGCTDKSSCESYCNDASHGGECVDFAEKAGFMSSKDAEQARKVLPLISRGESPGGCKTKEQCEKYCDNEANTMECVGFAEKAGFMTSEEAAIVRKTGGKGPGGCHSKEACDAYCNDSKNQEACFDFATKHDLIPPDKLKEIKEGMGRLRSGLKQMPASAVSCLKSELGDEAMAKVEDGSFMPGPKIGETIKGCVAKAMPEIKAKIDSAMQQATPETKACLEKGLGAGGLDKITGGGEMTPEMGDVMRNCFESMRTEGMKQLRAGLGQMPPEMKTCVEDKLGSDFIAKVESGADVDVGPEIGTALQSCAGKAADIMDKALEQAPPEMRDCIKSKIGDVSKIRGPQDVQGYISECMKNFAPKGIPSGAEGYRPPGAPSSGSESDKNIPPAGMPPAGAQIPASACAGFKMAPSCDYVPENVREMCKQCKGE